MVTVNGKIPAQGDYKTKENGREEVNGHQTEDTGKIMVLVFSPN